MTDIEALMHAVDRMVVGLDAAEVSKPFDPFAPACAKCGEPVDWDYPSQSYVHDRRTDDLDHAATIHGGRK